MPAGAEPVPEDGTVAKRFPGGGGEGGGAGEGGGVVLLWGFMTRVSREVALECPQRFRASTITLMRWPMSAEDSRYVRPAPRFECPITRQRVPLRLQRSHRMANRCAPVQRPRCA